MGGAHRSCCPKSCQRAVNSWQELCGNIPCHASHDATYATRAAHAVTMCADALWQLAPHLCPAAYGRAMLISSALIVHSPGQGSHDAAQTAICPLCTDTCTDPHHCACRSSSVKLQPSQLTQLARQAGPCGAYPPPCLRTQPQTKLSGLWDALQSCLKQASIQPFWLGSRFRRSWTASASASSRLREV